MPHTLSEIPRTWAGDLKITATDLAAGTLTGSILTANANSSLVQAAIPAFGNAVGTIGTTGAFEAIIRAPVTGTLAGAAFYSRDALAGNNTGYVTFTITNKGLAGAGTTVMLQAVDGNTTKATGGMNLGNGFAAYGREILLIQNNAVNAGEVISVVATVTGTLANTVTGSVIGLTFLAS